VWWLELEWWEGLVHETKRPRDAERCSRNCDDLVTPGYVKGVKSRSRGVRGLIVALKRLITVERRGLGK